MFLYSQWCDLPINKRHELAAHLGIQKLGSTHVQDDKIVSDGYSIKEVEKALTVDGLASFLGTGKQITDLATLWHLLVTGEMEEIPNILTKGKDLEPKHKGGRPKGSKNK